MAQQMSDKEIVSAEELLMAQMVQTDTVTQLLIEEVQTEYQSKGAIM